MGEIAAISPAVRRLRDLHIWEEKVGKLQHLLFSYYEGKNAALETGIWNAHCAPRKAASKLEMLITGQLREIEEQANIMIEQGLVNYRKPFPLPLNTVLAKDAGRYGEVSYPNFAGGCRQLNYPDLNLLYNACKKARVDCLQVYLFRHPLEILNSVVKRGYVKNDTSTMQIYITHLHVMANQLRMHALKTLGCFGFFSKDDSWGGAQKDLWAWFNSEKYKTVIGSLYKTPERSNMTNTKQLQQWIWQSEHAPFVRSWWNVHLHARHACQQAVRDVRR